MALAAGSATELDVLLVVPWYGGSHRSWADAMVGASRHNIGLVTHEAAQWRWRFQGGPITLATGIVEDIARFGQPDIVVVSSMTDIASLLGLCRHSIRDTPVVAYRHESQLIHPQSPAQAKAPVDESAALAEWRSLLAADEVWFNSSFHLESYLAKASDDLLSRDVTPSIGATLEIVRERAIVVPIGVEMSDIVFRRPAPCDEPTILYNQRWETDKAPASVLNALDHVARSGRRFRLALAGPRTQSLARPTLGASLRDRLDFDEEADRTQYVQLLGRADIVVSNAEHEFFGISPVEAVASGCVPLFPRRENYPSLVADRDIFLHDGHDLVPRLGELLDQFTAGYSGLFEAADSLHRSIAAHDVRNVQPCVDARLESIADRRLIAERSPHRCLGQT